jgi:hypothetical protein
MIDAISTIWIGAKNISEKYGISKATKIKPIEPKSRIFPYFSLLKYFIAIASQKGKNWIKDILYSNMVRKRKKKESRA